MVVNLFIRVFLEGAEKLQREVLDWLFNTSPPARPSTRCPKGNLGDSLNKRGGRGGAGGWGE